MTAMSKSKRQDGWWYPWIFVAAFGVIIIVNGIMAYIASSTWTGLETEKAFKVGQNFNARLAQKSAQAAMGWKVGLQFKSFPTPDKPHGGQVQMRFIDAKGVDIEGLKIQAIAKRPTHEGYDRVLEFTDRTEGRYIAITNLPLAGLWDIHLETRLNGQLFKAEHRIQVP
ncbi:MAG: hypothetical protein COB59_06865 [Rhodospirillaceae bacterium]|nr:MAG: hypothetical protein COB59_06865 [Rhodospirillaceae bacterium]